MDMFFNTLHRTGLEAEGGITGLAERLTVRQKTLHSKLNPDDEAAEPKISEFIRIMKDTQDTSPLDELCRMFGGKFTTSTNEKAESLVSAVLLVGSSHGHTLATLKDAIEDGVIDDNEMLAIIVDLNNTAHAIEVLRNTAKYEHDSSNKKTAINARQR